MQRRNAAVGQDPLLPHPLAATPASDAEPTLGSAYAATTTTTSPPSSPPSSVPRNPPLSPRSVLDEEPLPVQFISRRRRGGSAIPRVIAPAGGMDPLTHALREQEPPPPPPPPAGAAYATALDTLEQQPSSEKAVTSGAGELGIGAGKVTISPVRGPVVDVRVQADTVAGVFSVETWREEPAEQAEGGNVRNQSNVPPSPSTSSVSGTGALEYMRVTRSIADFVWLEGRLRARYDGVIVPHLPPMGLRGRMMYGFMYEMERLRGLHRFVALLCAHPMLAHVEETTAFLGDRGHNAWIAARRRQLERTRSVALGEERGPGGTLRQWGAFRMWQAGRRLNRGVGWFLNREQETVHLSAEERALERLQSYVRDLQRSLRNLRSASKTGADASNACSARYADVQRALRVLGEKEGGGFGQLLKGVRLVEDLEARSDHEAEIAAILGGSAGADRLLDDVLLDYETRAVSAQRLVQLRCDEREAYEYAVENYAALRARWEASTSSVWDNRGGDGDADLETTAELRALQTQLAAAADTLTKAQRQYQQVDRSTNDELRRLRTHLHTELLGALRGVAHERAKQHAAMRDGWLRLSASIDDVEEDESLRAGVPLRVGSPKMPVVDA